MDALELGFGFGIATGAGPEIGETPFFDHASTGTAPGDIVWQGIHDNAFRRPVQRPIEESDDTQSQTYQRHVRKLDCNELLSIKELRASSQQ